LGCGIARGIIGGTRGFLEREAGTLLYAEERAPGFVEERPLRDPGLGQARVPDALNGTRREAYEFVILGAGCAGLSLCHYLLEEGIDAPILIVDRRASFDDDRTWCFWDVEPTPFSHLA
jgi:hypothetical protein